MTGTPLYSRWRAMLGRTCNPNNTEYGNYGGRGITVCERWQSFQRFAEDMECDFSVDLELDRIDVNGPYAPQNCRWATRVQQQRNRRNNHLIIWRGTTATSQEWAEKLGLRPNTLIYRLRHGWSVDRALTVGVRAELLRIANGGAS